jgi:hypothetical protein
MSQPLIVPVAKSIYLCDGHIGLPNHKTDLMGLFNAIRPSRYPHVQKQFVTFAQLIGGLGAVPVYIDVRLAANRRLIHTTPTQNLHFPSRKSVIQLAYEIRQCHFPIAGRYLVELFCNGVWVADTTLDLL